MSYQLVYRGIVHDSQGYSRASREYIFALDALGVDVKIEPINYGTPSTKLLPEQAKKIRELIEKPYATDKDKVLLVHLQPHGLDVRVEKNKGYKKVVLMTVWETTKIPDNWFPAINEVDMVIVPSKLVVDSMVNSGVTAPIKIVPHGADTESFHPNIEGLKIEGTEKTFNFLSVFKWEHRKAPEILLKAFWNEFTNKDNVSLIIKSSLGNSKDSIRQVSETIVRYKNNLGFGNDRANIYYSGSEFSESDMRSLYGAGDAFVLPTRGEGVGLPYMEAMSCGMPVIATGWGGQIDFTNNYNGYLIDYEMLNCQAGEISPSFNIFTGDMEWAEPDVESLQKLMRHCYENQKEVAEKGKQARKTMEEMTWAMASKDIQYFIEEVM